MERSSVYSEISVRTEWNMHACKKASINEKFTSLDTNSFSISGEHDVDRDENKITITHGYSKDHRPDLKQVVLELVTSQDGGIPLMIKCFDGNASDNKILKERCTELMKSFKRHIEYASWNHMPKKIKKIVASCETCFAKAFCDTFNVTADTFHPMLHEESTCKHIASNHALFHKKDVFQYFYVVKQGAFKKYTLLEDGREQIIAFYLPGDLIGLDAVNYDFHPFSVVALSDSIVCEITAKKILSFIQKHPDTQEKLMKITSEQFHHYDAIPRNAHAKEKVAAFLINIVTRYYHALVINENVHLPMSRQDIGNYLGLTVETISRIFTELKSEGMLTTQGKNIVILDSNKLKKIKGF